MIPMTMVGRTSICFVSLREETTSISQSAPMTSHVSIVNSGVPESICIVPTTPARRIARPPFRQACSVNNTSQGIHPNETV
jgi:hypothetical protein